MERGPTDPIITAIENYRAGVRTYDARSFSSDEEADACAAEMMDPPLRVLKDWDKPAATLAGAIAAIEFADEELDKYANSEAVPRMIKAALALLKPVAPATVPTAGPECQSAQRDARHPLQDAAGAAC